MTHFTMPNQRGMQAFSPYRSPRLPDDAEHTEGPISLWRNPKNSNVGNFSNSQTSGYSNSQLRFLNWVAFTRKYDPTVDETERRTCPLIGCERVFYDPEIMLQHVSTCPQLSGGLYRCTSCYQERKISKNLSHTCRPLQLPKPRRSSVANSLRLAKKFFPHRRAKSDSAAGEAVTPGITPRWLNELNSLAELPCNPNFATELEAPWPYTPELQTLEVPAELAVDGNFMSYSTANIQNGPFEFPTNEEVIRGLEPQVNVAELESGIYPMMSKRPSQMMQRFKDVQEYNPDSRLTSPMPNSSSPDQLTQTNHMTRPAQNLEYASRINLLSLDISASLEYSQPGDNMEMISPLDSRESPASMTRYSTVSSMSSSPTLNSSMSSFDFDSTTSQQQFESIGSFFSDDGSQILYAEPESMDFESSLRELGADFDNFKNTKNAQEKAQAEQSCQNLYQILGLVDTPPQERNNIPKITETPQTRQDIISPQKRPPTPITPTKTKSPKTTQKPEQKYRCACGYEPQGKKVNKASNLKRHQKTCEGHTPYPGISRKKPWKCSVCGNRFTRSDSMLEHRRRKKHLGNIQFALRSASSGLISGLADRESSVEVEDGDGNGVE